MSDRKLILQSRKRCSASSSQHVDCGNESRGSGGELLGALDAGVWVVGSCWHGCGHGCSWRSVAVVSSWCCTRLTGLDDHDGLADWDLGSSTAEIFSTDSLVSLRSEGTIWEGLLTSSTCWTSSRFGSCCCINKSFNCGDVCRSGGLSGGKSGGVAVECGFLACDDGSEMGGTCSSNLTLLCSKWCLISCKGCSCGPKISCCCCSSCSQCIECSNICSHTSIRSISSSLCISEFSLSSGLNWCCSCQGRISCSLSSISSRSSSS